MLPEGEIERVLREVGRLTLQESSLESPVVTLRDSLAAVWVARTTFLKWPPCP
jgi:hypothetical protein